MLLVSGLFGGAKVTMADLRFTDRAGTLFRQQPNNKTIARKQRSGKKQTSAEKTTMRRTCTLLMLAALLPARLWGVPVKPQSSKSRNIPEIAERQLVQLPFDWVHLPSRGITEGCITSGILLVNAGESLWNRCQWYVLAGMVILILQGVSYVLLAREARRRKVADRAARRRYEFHRLLSEMTARLANSGPEGATDEISHAIDHLRVHLAVDRICMFSSINGDEFRLLCTSAGAGIDSAALPVQIENSPWFLAQVGRGRAVLIDKVGHLPAEAAAEKRMLKEKGIQSIAIVPFATDQSLSGFFTLTANQRQRGWPEDLVSQIQIMGDVFRQTYMRQRVENKVREMERRFVLAADSAPVMIWMSGTDKMCTYCNQGWLAFTGRSVDQEMGSGWLEGVHPQDAKQSLADYAEAFNGRRRFKLEYRLRRFDGEYRWIADYGVPRYEPEGVFCGYIGSCIDITDLKRSEYELKELSGQLIHAQEDERKRIARELHDDFSQQLTLLGLELAKLSVTWNHEPGVKRLVLDVEARIRELARAMNNRAHQLHSSHLETLGLASAIQGFCREFSKQHEIDVDFRQDRISPQIPSNVSLCLFRIVQEGLQNVAKHSQTKNCSVDLTAENEHVMLRISDSGIGFDPASLGHKAGLGLISMRERLRLVNGQIRLLSSPKRGTQLEIQVPLKRASAIHSVKAS